jgi:BMFP domain-containing protein YqiC
MQTSNRILDDLARVANGAVSTLSGVKGEIDAMVRQRIEHLLVDADLVPRDEFDAVKAMAAEARAEQDRLAKRVAALEAQLGKSTVKKAALTKRKTAAKTKAVPRRKAASSKAAK